MLKFLLNFPDTDLVVINHARISKGRHTSKSHYQIAMAAGLRRTRRVGS